MEEKPLTSPGSEKQIRWNLELIGYVNHGGAEHINNQTRNEGVGQNMVSYGVSDVALVVLYVNCGVFLHRLLKNLEWGDSHWEGL